VSDALQGLWSRLRWNKPPKGFEKFFKDKPAAAPKQEPPKSSAPKESSPKSGGGGGGGGASAPPPPKSSASKSSPSPPDFSKFFKNAKSGGIGGDGDKQRLYTMAAFGTGALLLFFFANQESILEKSVSAEKFLF
jgi:hypothetical protein